MRNIALLIEYEGTAYSGWQVQKNSSSIQAVIEKTLSELLQEKIKIVGAGRTDAGVHAHGQVANFHTSSDWDVRKLVYAANGNLPVDIALRKVADVPDSFHSRFDAVARKYVYKIITRKTPIMRNFSAFFPYELSIEKMNEAAALVVGERSFKSFTKYADEHRHFICKVTRAEWKQEKGERGRGKGEKRKETEGLEAVSCLLSPTSFLLFEIEANRFLHGMVRAIVGTLIDVGRGKIAVGDLQEILNSEKRSLASMSAPACGLFLEEVKYEFDLWGGTTTCPGKH